MEPINYETIRTEIENMDETTLKNIKKQSQNGIIGIAQAYAHIMRILKNSPLAQKEKNKLENLSQQTKLSTIEKKLATYGEGQKYGDRHTKYQIEQQIQPHLEKISTFVHNTITNIDT